MEMEFRHGKLIVPQGDQRRECPHTSDYNFDASIRWAEGKNIAAVKRLADDNRTALGFVVKASLEAQLRRRGLLVCDHKGKVVGFVSFHHRRDGWTTIYDVCVEDNHRGRGLGRALIGSVERESLRAGQIGIRLKCPVDLPANGFYARLGFTRIGVENGKRRPLVVWEKVLSKEKPHSVFAFFVTLTHYAKGIKDIICLWDVTGDKRDPFKRIIFTPLFSPKSTIALIRDLKEKRGSIVMFDSGGYQVQMGTATYEELFDRLLQFYRKNDWADWYVLPDHVPRSSDSDIEVEFKVRETIDFARLFLRRMPEKFVKKAVGVVHGRTEEQVCRCVKAYAAMGIGYIGFGSFGTSGPNGTVNLVSQRNLSLLRLVQTLAHEHGLRLHIFGIGSPRYLIRLADAGIMPTSFDSAGWWKAGGFGKIFFPSGRQLHITRVDQYKATKQGIQYEKRRTQHDCPFCADIFQLRQHRIMRVMHNLAAMLDTVERVSRP